MVVALIQRKLAVTVGFFEVYLSKFVTLRHIQNLCGPKLSKDSEDCLQKYSGRASL